MATAPCPACGNVTPKLLDEPSKLAAVIYYRCHCGMVWTTDKNTGAIVRHVTPLPDTPPDRE